MSIDIIILIQIIILAIYIADSLLLLYRNEAILIPSTGEKWYTHFPTHRPELLRRYLYIPNPLSPHLPLFKTYWDPGKCHDRGTHFSNIFIDEIGVIKQLGILIKLLALLLLFCVPITLYIPGTAVIIFIEIVLIYIVIGIILYFAYKLHDKYNFTTGKFLSIAFESLICAPCALNIIRKISLAAEYNLELLTLSQEVLDDEGYCRVVNEVLSIVDVDIVSHDEFSHDYKLLNNYRRSLIKLAGLYCNNQ